MTVPVLLRLTETFGVEAAYFAPHDASRLTAELRDALVDELEGGNVSGTEFAQLAERMPSVARAVTDLRSRHHRIAAAAGIRDEGLGVRPLTAQEQVCDFFSRRARDSARSRSPPRSLSSSSPSSSAPSSTTRSVSISPIALRTR